MEIKIKYSYRLLFFSLDSRSQRGDTNDEFYAKDHQNKQSVENIEFRYKEQKKKLAIFWFD